MNLGRFLDASKAISIVNDVRARGNQGQNMIRKEIAKAKPDLIGECLRWNSSTKVRYCIGIVDLYADRVCRLEQDYTVEMQKRIMFTTAVGKILDDLMDEGRLEAKDVGLFSNKKPTPDTIRVDKFEFLYTLNDILDSMLPEDFKDRFSHSIDGFNQAQALSAGLSNSSIDIEEIKRIRDAVGGYTAIVVYCLLFPKRKDPSKNISLSYDPCYMQADATLENAIFNIGALAARLDDMYDIYSDKGRTRTLGTEGILTWEQIQRDSDMIFTGLKKLYPERKVTAIQELYDAAMNKTTRNLFKAAGFLRKLVD
jgi:hypothetical protein